MMYYQIKEIDDGSFWVYSDSETGQRPWIITCIDSYQAEQISGCLNRGELPTPDQDYSLYTESAYHFDGKVQVFTLKDTSKWPVG